MTRSNLYKEILPRLVDFLSTTGLVTEVLKDSILDELLILHYEEACDQLIFESSVSKYKKIIQYIRDGISDNSEIMDVLPVRHKEAETKNRDRLKPFCYKRADLAVLPVKKIIEEVNNTSNPDWDSNSGKVIDLIWLEYKDTVAELNYFWECFTDSHINDYYILTREPESPLTDWRLYSYGYLCFVNEYRFERPTELNYTGANAFVASIPFNSANQYEQYFDAYNVMSESKYSDDVLSRYLRMFQILEYFGYRRTLADMTKGNIKENGFVRNLISKVNGRSTIESVEIKTSLKDLIPNLAGDAHTPGVFDAADFTLSMQSFIKDKLLLPYNYNDSRIWDVIYKLRNCIVHNKESELHFTYSNTDVYRDGIDLMKVIIKKLEPKIVNVINDPSITGLEFSSQMIQVY